MKRYEIRTEEERDDDCPGYFPKKLAEMGLDGWQLINVFATPGGRARYVFQRKLPPMSEQDAERRKQKLHGFM